MTGQIVVAVNGWRSAEAALRWAAAEAAQRGARLRIVHVREPWAYEFPFKAGPRFRGSLPAYWRRALAAAVEWVHTLQPEVEVTAAMVTGAVPERLVTESEEADELILGGKGLSGLAGLLLGSVGRSVTEHAASPVIVVRRSAPTEYGEVLVGFDGSARSEAALDYAFQEARSRRARLRVLYARWMSPFSPGAREALAKLSDSVRRRLLPWQERYPDVPVIGAAVRGHPVSALSRASRQADLLVVGSKTPGLLGSAALGSVGQGVLRRARCPVAVVPPRESEPRRPVATVVG